MLNLHNINVLQNHQVIIKKKNYFSFGRLKIVYTFASALDKNSDCSLLIFKVISIKKGFDHILIYLKTLFIIIMK